MVQWKKMGSQTEDECLVSLVSIFGPFFHFQDCWKNLPKTLKNYLYNPTKNVFNRCVPISWFFERLKKITMFNREYIFNRSIFRHVGLPRPLPAPRPSTASPRLVASNPPNRDGTTFDPPPKNRCYKKRRPVAISWVSHSWRMPEGIHQFTKNLLI